MPCCLNDITILNEARIMYIFCIFCVMFGKNYQFCPKQPFFPKTKFEVRFFPKQNLKKNKVHKRASPLPPPC